MVALSEAVGARLARTTTSPSRNSAGRRAASAAMATSARDGASAPQADIAATATATASSRSIGRGSVIGRGQFATAPGCRAHRARDQVAEAAGLEGFDRRLRGAAGRGDPAPQLGRRLAGLD